MDFNDSLVFVAGDDKTVNFDMTRKEYIDKMTPEEKKQLEDYKKKMRRCCTDQCKDRQSECAADAGARRQQGGQLRCGDHGDADGDEC